MDGAAPTVAIGKFRFPMSPSKMVKRGYPSDAMTAILDEKGIDLLKRVWAA